jgi:uncharacterized surface protein with fasciclin (FAS1) repeats
MMPRANAPVAPQQVAMPMPQAMMMPPVDERSSMVTMASNVLFYSGLATLAAGAGMALRRTGAAPTETELTQALTGDVERGDARAVSRVSTIKMATVGNTLATADGPEIFWGPDGPLQDPMKEESDFKEYDKFSIFVQACQANGIDLNQPDITVLAPANVACAEYEAIYGPLTKDICAYHVIKGVVSTDGLSGAPLNTLQGGTITYRRMFRKDFVDNAMCGVKASPPRSSYAANLKCDNGVIHGINEVIYPGWSETDASTQDGTGQTMNV